MKNVIFLFCLFFCALGYSQNQLIQEKNLEKFIDQQLQTEVDKNNIAGATITIIKDGKTLFQKGYGYADIANQKKVDGKNTLFRVASISKLFVWVAIMKLQEEGKLDLNDEITKHLPDLDIPNNYPQKITIKHLMSHCAGFEDESLSIFVKDPDFSTSIKDILSVKIPKQVRPPATYSSYSNYGTGMAALIVENITKMSFNDYVEQKILTPLGMTHSTFRQVLPAHLEALNSKGYKKIEETLVEQNFEYVPLYPVGGASISGGDMAKFMQMLLNHGRLGDAVIMDSTTSQLMATTSHQHHPLVNPMRHGYMDLSQNGLHIYGHGGDLFYHHSLLTLIPEQNLGFFISINSAVGFPGLQNTLFMDFMDEYFPEKVEKLPPSTAAALAPFGGTYALNRYSYDDILKLGKLIGAIEIEITKDGYLKTAFGDVVVEWVQENDLVFRDRESSERLVFERGANGTINHAFIGGFPTMALDKLEGIDKPVFHGFVFAASLIISIITLGYWLLNFFIRRKNKSQNLVHFPQSTKNLTLITLVLVLLFHVGLVILFSRGVEIVYGIPDYAYLLFSIPFLVIGLTGLLLYKGIQLWQEKEGLALWKKGAFMVINLCLLLSIFQWYYWNFIGFNF